MIQWLKRLWLIVIGRTPRPTEATVLAAGLVPPPIEEPSMTRAERRARESDARRFYRRQRLKKDKFVTPQGPEPRKLSRSLSSHLPPRPEPMPELVSDDDYHAIVDVHHSDRRTKVLYEFDEMNSKFCFRDTILDDLPIYFDYLARMKRSDWQAWGLYREIGALLVPYLSVGDIVVPLFKMKERKVRSVPPLSPWFLEERPSFGCVAYGTNAEVERLERERPFIAGRTKDCWIPKFIYFTKYERKGIPPKVARVGAAGDVYLMTVYWDKRQGYKRKSGSPQQFPIFVAADGSMRVLRCFEINWLGPKRLIPQHRWAIPHEMHEWAQNHDTTAQIFLTRLFRDVCQTIEQGNASMARIDVEKDGQHAYFALAIERMPYFFKDRDRVLTSKGFTKRIFHCVRPHKDRHGNYQQMTFRGLRDFMWAGYRVRITLPGKDHMDITDFNVGSYDDARMSEDDKRESMTEPEMGKQFREHMQGTRTEAQLFREQAK